MPRPRSPANAAEPLVGVAPLVSRWIERVLAAHEPQLTLGQFLALRAIAAERLTAAELARRTGVSATGAVTVPISQTSTFVQEAVGEHKGYEYASVSNPTRTALQLCLASLEGAEHGVAFSSGLGAVTTIMHLLNPGDRVVAVADVYGGVYRMFSQVYEPKGYAFEWVPADELNADPAARLDERTR